MANRLALITGAERGIGKETARQLVERGFSVVIAGYDMVAAQSTVDELSAVGEVRSVRMDVADDQSIDDAFEDIGSASPTIDVLVNNAGTVARGSAIDVTREQLRVIFDVNVFGAAMVTRAALPFLRRSAHPRIVNLSSGGGSLTRTTDFAKTGSAGAPILAYAASKCALNMITVQTHLVLQSDPLLRHIKINSASPGTTATQISGFQGQSVSDGARIVVHLATIDDAGPSGGYFELDGPVEW